MSKLQKFLTKWSKRARMLTRLILFKLGLDKRPLFAVLTVNANCNFRCKYCFADYHERVERPLSTEQLMHIIDELADFGVIYLNVHGGEALIRNDMGQILRHALGKRMFVNLITNGTLLQKRWEDVKDIDSFCISLDGRPENNDKNRGEGSFKVAAEAIDFARAQGVPVRIGMTVTKYTMGDLEWIAKWADERRIYIHHYLLFDQESLPEELRMTREENRTVLRELIALKKRGYPIFYSYKTLQYALDWPYEKEVLKRSDLEGLQIDPHFELVPCQYKNINVLIESNGTVRVCNAMVRHETHISVLDRPLREAKNELLNIDDCLYCYHLPKMEFSHLINLKFESVLNQFVNQMVEDVKALLFKKKKGAEDSSGGN